MLRPLVVAPTHQGGFVMSRYRRLVSPLFLLLLLLPGILPFSPTKTAIAAPQAALTLIAPLTLDRTTVRRGETITGAVTYRNDTGETTTIGDLVLAGRPPGGTNAGGPWLDFRPSGTHTLVPGQAVTLNASRMILADDPSGRWYAFSTYRNPGGVYRDAPIANNVAFTVTDTAPTATPLQPTATPRPPSPAATAVLPTTTPVVPTPRPATSTPPATVGTATPATGQLTIVAPLQLDRAMVARGATITGTVTYANTSGSPITIQALVIAARPPGGTNGGGPWLDLAPQQGGRMLAPGEWLTLTARRTMSVSDPIGPWYSFATYQDGAGVWHDDSRNAPFVVGSAAATPTATPVAATSPPVPTTRPTLTVAPTTTPPPTATLTPTTTSINTPSPAASGFVGRDGSNFTLDGQPFRFVGFNLYDAANTAGYSCVWWQRYSEAELDGAFGAMHDQAGATVVRFWAFQSYTAGGTDWSGMDRVLRLAAKHNMKVLPVLEDGPGYCGLQTPPWSNAGRERWQNNGTWYDQAWRRDFRYDGYALSLPDYIDRIVARYKDNPTILGWMLMNEADTSNVEGLYTFARVLSAQIKAVDSRHLVTLGSQSSGPPATAGANFLRVYGLPTIDFAEGHDYPYWTGGDGETMPLPGSPDGGRSLPEPRSAACMDTSGTPGRAMVGCALAQALRILGKPFVMGEVGVKGADSAATRARRAQLLRAKVDVFFANGGSGYLIWQWNNLVDTEQYDVLPGVSDPLLPFLKNTAKRLVGR